MAKCDYHFGDWVNLCLTGGGGGGAGRGLSLIFAGGTIQKKDSSADFRSPKVGISLRKMMAG